MRGALLPIVALLLIGGAAWWLLGAGGPEPASSPSEPTPDAARAPGALDPAAPAAAEAPGAAIGAESPARTTIDASAEAAAIPATAYRGRLRVVKGSLTLVPDLESWTRAAPGAEAARAPLRVSPEAHAFEIAVHGTEPSCELAFPDLLQPVAVNGAPLDESTVVPLAAAPAENLIDVEVRPHLAVQFLHEPSGRPLAGGRLDTALENDGSSTSWNGRLDEQGRTFFDFEQLSRMGYSRTLQFTVAWPPEIGSSQAPPIPVADLLLLPQPLIVRVASTPTLRFRVVDSRHEPVAGAQVRLGLGYSSDQRSDEDGRASVLQSSPAAAEVRVQADGFLTALDPLTAAAESDGDEQEVMLWPGSWIEISGHEEPPGGWGQIDVEIRFDGEADASLLMPHRFQTGQFTVSSSGTGTTSNRQKRSFKHTTSLSSQGQVKLDGIHVDVPATVILTYRGAILLETRVPIRPGDGGHQIEVPPLPETLEVRGRVTDLAGRALAGVEVRAFLGERASEVAETDAAGEYRLGQAPVGRTVRLRFAKPGFARSSAEHLVEPGAESVIRTVALEPGRRVVLRILDADGAPFRPDSDLGTPCVRWNGHAIAPVEDPGAGLGPGEWLFTDLPAGEVDFQPTAWNRADDPVHRYDTATPFVTIRLTPEQTARLRRDG